MDNKPSPADIIASSTNKPCSKLMPSMWRKFIRLPFLLSALSFCLLMYSSVDTQWSRIRDLNKPGENTDLGIWKYSRLKQQQQQQQIYGDNVEYLNMKDGAENNVKVPDWLSMCRLCLFAATTLGFATVIFTLVLSFRDTLDGLWVLLTQTLSALFTLLLLCVYTIGRRNFFESKDGLLETFGCSYYMVVCSGMLSLTDLVILCLNLRLEKVGRIVCLV